MTACRQRLTGIKRKKYFNILSTPLLTFLVIAFVYNESCATNTCSAKKTFELAPSGRGESSDQGINGRYDSDEDEESLFERVRKRQRPPPTTGPDMWYEDKNAAKNEKEASSSDNLCNCLDGDHQGARIAYLITVHNERTSEDAAYLFRAIRAPGTIIIIHVDKKFAWNEYLDSSLHGEIDRCPCGAEVLEDSLFDSEWGEWSMNDPTHWGMRVLVNRFKGRWDVFMNLSGDTMPTLNPTVMAKLFDPNNGPLRDTNFVTSSSCETGFLPTNVYDFPEKWHKRSAYTHHPEGMPIIRHKDEHGVEQETTLTIHFGSQWMSLKPDFVEYIVSSMERKDSLASRFRNFLIETSKLMADETFIPTILMNVAPFKSTLPKLLEDGNLASYPSMYAIRYERMDEHCPTAFGYFPTEQRYDVPDKSLADKPKIWGPYFLGVYDLANIKRSGALFIRKVSVFLEPNIVHMLPVDSLDSLPNIEWTELKISDVPDWEKKRDELIRKAKEREEKNRAQ